MIDMNGVEIKAGDILFNPHDRDRYHNVLNDSEGNLFLGDLYSPLEKYSPEKFWAVVYNIPAERLCPPVVEG